MSVPATTRREAKQQKNISTEHNKMVVKTLNLMNFPSCFFPFIFPPNILVVSHRRCRRCTVVACVPTSTLPFPTLLKLHIYTKEPNGHRTAHRENKMMVNISFCFMCFVQYLFICQSTSNDFERHEASCKRNAANNLNMRAVLNASTALFTPIF